MTFMKKFLTFGRIQVLLIILVSIISLCRVIYVATATTWTDRTASGSHFWTGIACSSDCSKILAADNYDTDSYLYRSTDGGITWNTVTNGGSAFQKRWKHVASSADGSVLLASELTGDLWYSTDSGANWTDASTLGSGSWTGLAMSSDGATMVAISNGGGKVGFWKSTNSGSSWTDTSGLDLLTPNAIACSSDCSKIAVAMFGDYIYTSSNTGDTWTARTGSPSGFWTSIASSSDGTKLAATLSFAGDLYTSSDSGVNWTDQTDAGTGGGGLWQSVAMSSDGTKLIAVSTVNVRSSTNSGANWTTETGPGTATWKKAASSSDGAYWVIGGTSTDIWTAGTPPVSAPSVTTSAASSVTTTTATFNGNITSTGNENPTTRGFYYGLTTGYGTTSSTSGSYSAGAYTASITGLVCNTTYHYQAFATNTGGTGTGSDQSFTTSACPVAPTVTTSSTTSGITHGSALLTGTISSTGGENPTSRYIEYGTTISYGSQSVADTGSFSTGSFNESVRGLTAGTTYHYRACAQNSAGTGCGIDRTFTTLAAPGTPASLSGTAGYQQVSLTWTAPVSSGGYDITDYMVEYKTTSGATWYVFNDGVSTSASAIVTSLTNGVSYDFRVSAVSDAGAGTATSSISRTPSSTHTEPNAPTNLSGTGGNTQVSLSWTAPANNGGASITDYQIEYKTISAGSWSTFSHSASTATSRAVTGLTNGTTYMFRVSAVNSVGTSVASSAITVGAGSSIYRHILSTGQSLSEGVNSSPALTATQPYNNKSLSNSPDGGLSAPLIPLVETVNGRESPASGRANYLSAALSGNPVFVDTIHGQGGQTYASIKKGGSGSAYTNGQTQASVVQAQTVAASAYYLPFGVTLTHGESDAIAGTSASTYESETAQMQIDYESDWNALTGRSDSIPLFESQMNTNSEGTIAVAQLDAHKNNSGKVILVGPKYQLGYYSDGLHLSSLGSKMLGELYAKVMKKVLVDGETWNPLMPLAVTNEANVVTIDYHIPEGTLAVDTTNVALRTNKGFEFYQTGGSSLSISSVVLDATNKKVVITLSGTPDGTDPHIRYAWTCENHPNDNAYATCGGPGDSGAVGGNIRDTDTTTSPASNGTGERLYDWAVAFDEAITSPSVPAVPTDLSVTSGNTQASLTWTEPENTNGSAITDYYIEYKTASASVWSAYSHVASTTTSATISGLTNGTSYMFRVSAVNEYGTGAPTAVSYAVPVTTPGSPTSLNGVGGTAEVSLSWTAPVSDGGSIILDYLVEYKTTGAISWSTFDDGVSNTTSATVTSLSYGTSYMFRVSTVTAVATSSPSGTASASTSSAVEPDAPSLLTGSSGNTQVALTWTAPDSDGGSAITDYLVEYYDGVGWNTFSDGVSTSTSATVTGLINGSIYSFRVSAINSVGTGLPSATISRIPITTAGAPTGLSATAGNTTVALTWTAPLSNGGSSITDYLIEYKLHADSSWTTFADGTSTSTSATVTGLSNGSNYDFRVSTINASGTSTASSTESATPVAPSLGGGGGRIQYGRPPLKNLNERLTYISPIDNKEYECNPFVSTTLIYLSKNNDVSQVKLWQAFLNQELSLKLPVTGYFGVQTISAVKKFQTKYSTDVLAPAGLKYPTGLIRKLTITKANKILGCK